MDHPEADRLIAELRVAMEHRTAIGVALGILMERHHMSRSEAWDLMVAASQSRQRKVYELAVEMGASRREPQD